MEPIKIVVVGNGYVGKSYLTVSYVENRYLTTCTTDV